MKTLVTGGAGFIGAHLVRALLDRGDEVTLIDNFSTGDRSRLHEGARLVEGDIRDRALLETLFAEGGFEVVYHTAALARIQPSVRDPINSHDVNVTGTLNLLDASRRHGVKRFVYSSSSTVYGNGVVPFREETAGRPINPYGIQKWMGEEWCRLYASLYSLDTVCLRYFNVYGPGMIEEGAYRTVIQIFLGQLRRGEPLTIVGKGEIRRDFTHVDDIVKGNILAALHPRPLMGEAFNLGYGRSIEVREVAERILAARGKTWEKDTVPLPSRPEEAPETLADHSKAAAAFGWKPETSFDDGLTHLLSLEDQTAHA